MTPYCIEMSFPTCNTLKQEIAPILNKGWQDNFPCNICSKIYKHPTSLRHHKRFHTNPYRCPLCLKPFSRKYDMTRHLHKSCVINGPQHIKPTLPISEPEEEPSNTKPEPCILEGDPLNALDSLMDPRFGITVWNPNYDESKDPLNLVEAILEDDKSQGDIERHHNTEIPLLDKLLEPFIDENTPAWPRPPPLYKEKCPECGNRFMKKSTLAKHRLRTHLHNLKRIPCPCCNMTSTNLTTHMQEVHGTKGIVCPYCAGTFSKNKDMNRHIDQVHLNIQLHKPVICPYCNKMLGKLSTLKKHINTIHQGKKGWSQPCPYCGKILSRQANLKKHIAIKHLGQKKQCVICHMSLSDLRKHMVAVHGEPRENQKSRPLLYRTSLLNIKDS